MELVSLRIIPSMPLNGISESKDDPLYVSILFTPQCKSKFIATPKRPKVSSHDFKSNLKCCNFCIQCPNSIKLVGKFALSILVCVVKFSDQYKMK